MSERSAGGWTYSTACGPQLTQWADATGALSPPKIFTPDDAAGWAAANTAFGAAVTATGGGGGSVTVNGTEQIDRVCFCDDTANDGTNIVSFVKAYSRKIVTGSLVSQFLGDFTDGTLATAYTIVGTAAPCGKLGSTAKVALRARRMEGPGTFTFPATTVSLGYQAFNLTDPDNNPPTFTDSAGQVTEIKELSGVSSEAATDLANGLYSVPPTITITQPGDVIFVHWNELA